MSVPPAVIPSMASLVDWHVGLSKDGVPEVVIRLSDREEARTWAAWLFDRAVHKPDVPA